MARGAHGTVACQVKARRLQRHGQLLFDCECHSFARPILQRAGKGLLHFTERGENQPHFLLQCLLLRLLQLPGYRKVILTPGRGRFLRCHDQSHPFVQISRLPISESLNTLGDLIERKLPLVFEKNLSQLKGSRLLPRVGIKCFNSSRRIVRSGASCFELAHDPGHELTGDAPEDLLDAVQGLHVRPFQPVTLKLIDQFRECARAGRGRIADPLLPLLLPQKRCLGLHHQWPKPEQGLEKASPNGAT